MSELIDREALRSAHGLGTDCADCKQSIRSCQYDRDFSRMDFCEWIDDAPTIDAIPIKFIYEVIEYLEKCRAYAIHEETKTAWNDEAVALIMLLHEWDAWNECGRTGKYGERRADDE